MEAPQEYSAEEVKRLQHCINDLVSVLALPAIWAAAEASQVVRVLLDALGGMLDLDFVYGRLESAGEEAPIEMVHLAPALSLLPHSREIGLMLAEVLGQNPRTWEPLAGHPFGGRMLSIVPFGLGLHGEVGVVVAGCRRADFPQPTEILLLNVAVNQATIGLQEAVLLGEQRRVACELDRQIAQRTAELAAANKRLRESDAQKAAILDSALDCIVTMDHEGRILEFNPAAQRTFGYRFDEVVGRFFADIVVAPSLRETYRVGFAHRLASGETRGGGERVEMTAVKADGGEFPIEIAMSRIPVAGPPIFTGYLRDITERKRAEEELRHSEAFLAEAQRLTRVGSFAWRVATGEIAWSEELYRIFEFEQGTAVTLERIGSRIHPDDTPVLADMIARARSEGSDFGYEHRLLMPDGSFKHVHMIAHATRDAEGRLEYIGAAQDVTQRKVAEVALSKARSELAHVSRVTSLGVLTASIAHELNQPLASIVTGGEAALRWLARSEPDLEEVRVLARQMVADARRASEVIDRTRAMAAKRPIQRALLSLDDVVQESVVFLSHELISKRTSLSLDLSGMLPNILGDRTQLQQVVVNLAINAVQAMTDSGSMRRLIRIQTLQGSPEMVTCIVEDSGPGLEPANIPRLFDGFFTTKDTGLGMGLPISQAIIVSHGGRLQADNNSAFGGARFSFALPCRHAASGPAPCAPDVL